jgi:glycosyltransferase involved in cell wall biosynthesis
MVRAIDHILQTDAAPDFVRHASWKILTPSNTIYNLDLKVIQVCPVGSRTGHVWDQTDLAFASRGGPLISLTNSGPVFHRDHRIVIHDAQVFRHPEYFDKKYALLHRTIGRLMARRAKIATVSQFSRRELSEFLHIPLGSIAVYPNSADHLAGLVQQDSILQKLKLSPQHFFLAVGSVKKNKNIQVALDAVELLARPDYPLVVVGAQNDRVFRPDRIAAKADTIFAGFLPDEEIAALYRHATAFVFPSLYEGFGVPPLEAMVCGCPIIASDVDAVREVCADAAAYFDPMDAVQLRNLMEQQINAGPITEAELTRQRRRIAKYSWNSSALDLLNSFTEGRGALS